MELDARKKQGGSALEHGKISPQDVPVWVVEYGLHRAYYTVGTGDIPCSQKEPLETVPVGTSL